LIAALILWLRTDEMVGFGQDAELMSIRLFTAILVLIEALNNEIYGPGRFFLPHPVQEQDVCD